ncbi:MAG: hypothetical protein A2Y38_21165 [Spirochaetes bacterium GWB1_59_5]|nr:MAG: hypothetical protein A2Y38_21165 [Spirochaetes bacterium GWB1_59_5]
MIPGVARLYGVGTGALSPGPTNSIVDVAGVSVGHVTLSDGELQTGVTAVLPHCGNLFQDKVTAACRVLNGFGKSAGLVQVAELGTIESPILLSNTFSVATCIDGGLDVLLEENPDIATTTGSANVVAMECNDGHLSAMRRRDLTRGHVREAIRLAREAAGSAFSQGAVGAGRGMSCYGLKGGIGSASRVVSARAGRDEGSVVSFTVGALLLTNFGRLAELVVDGRRVGREIVALGETDALGQPSRAVEARAATVSAGDASGVGAPGAGSVIVILATDAPLDARQLRRLCVRAASGLARTGATIGNGSGEIALAFSTAATVPHYPETPVSRREWLHEDCLDPLFQAATESVEEAVLNSLFNAETVTGRDGHVRRSILDFGLYRV